MRDPSSLALGAVYSFPLGFGTRHVLGADKGVSGAGVAAELDGGFGLGSSDGVPGVLPTMSDGVLDGQVSVPFGWAFAIYFGAFQAKLSLDKLVEQPFVEGDPAT